MLVQDFLERTVDSLPDKVALICHDRRLNYAELETRANQMAHALLELGLRHGDRVAIYLENSPESVISIFGVLKAAGIFVVLNPLIKRRKLQHILSDCQVRVLITESKLSAEFNGADSDLAHVVFTDKMPADRDGLEGVWCWPFNELLDAQRTTRPRIHCTESDLCSLIYTSGSTGWPKGVMLNHRNMTVVAGTIIDYLQNTPEDVILNLLPLAFDYGLYNVLMPICFGGTVVLEKAFSYPYQLTGLVQKEKVSGLALVPMIVSILHRFQQMASYDLSTLRYITSTGQALPERHLVNLARVFPTAKIYSMYGLTECKRVSYLPPEQLSIRPTSVGKAIANTRAYIVDEQGNIITRAGCTGELIVEGDHVMQGYWRQPEESDRILIEGSGIHVRALRTGDLFRMDEEAYLYFVARKDELIKTAGERVSPWEIELLLNELDGVSAAAAYGVPHELLGQAIEVAIVPEACADLDVATVLAYCAEHMEKYMIPKHVEFLDALPTSPTGKTDYLALRSQARQQTQG